MLGVCIKIQRKLQRKRYDFWRSYEGNTNEMLERFMNLQGEMEKECLNILEDLHSRLGIL